MNNSVWFSSLIFLVWLLSCSDPVSPKIIKDDLPNTNYSVYTSSDRIFDLAWSSDGSLIAFISQALATDSITTIYNLKIYSVNNKTITTLYSESDNNLSHPSWSPDCSNLVCISGRDIVKIPAIGGAPVRLEADLPRYFYYPDNPSYSPDGSLIVFDYGGVICTIPANGGKVKIISEYRNFCHPAWSPDGKQLAALAIDYVGAGGNLHIFDFTDGMLHHSAGFTVEGSDICWANPHPVAGPQLLLILPADYGNDSTGMELRIMNFNARSNLPVIGKDGSLYKKNPLYLDACWAPDAETIAWIQSEDNSTGIYTMNIAHVTGDLN